MNKLIIDTLKPLGIPVSFQVYKGTATTYITFFEYNERPGLNADDKELQTNVYYQIDVWSKADYTSLVANAKRLLNEVGFSRINEFEQYEEDTGIYHRIIRIMNIKEVI